MIDMVFENWDQRQHKYFLLFSALGHDLASSFHHIKLWASCLEEAFHAKKEAEAVQRWIPLVRCPSCRLARKTAYCFQPREGIQRNMVMLKPATIDKSQC